jgi:hypothetical protein
MWVNSNSVLYNSKGEWLGHEVVEGEAFTKEELKNAQCPECGYCNGHHGEYFVKTGQNPGGEVHGFYRKCSRLGPPETWRDPSKL